MNIKLNIVSKTDLKATFTDLPTEVLSVLDSIIQQEINIEVQDDYGNQMLFELVKENDNFIIKPKV